MSPITVLGLATAGVLLGRLGGVEAISDHVPFGQEVSEAEVAVEARCGDLDSWLRRTCEEELTARFASGNADPDAVLRMHCTRARSVWDHSLPEPPALCAARFGGWLSG